MIPKEKGMGKKWILKWKDLGFMMPRFRTWDYSALCISKIVWKWHMVYLYHGWTETWKYLWPVGGAIPFSVLYEILS